MTARAAVAGALLATVLGWPAYASAQDRLNDHLNDRLSDRSSDSADRVARLFEEAGVSDATLVVAEAGGKVIFVHNPARALTRFSPASTFKVPNTLIALELGVAESAEHRFEWDGVERSVAAWNRDQTLRSALRVSCVWCYQAIAREVGREQYDRFLAAFDYGNQAIGAEIDQFWLDGSLKVSAFEQLRFLARLVNGFLPVSDRHRDVLADIMRYDEGDGATLYMKTGWTGSALATGWVVGYVDAGRRIIFVMNMTMTAAEQAPLRQSLTMEALKELGLL